MSGGPERSVVLAVTPLHVWSGLSALLPQAYHTSLLIDQTEYWFNANGVAVSRFSSHAGLGGVTQLLDMGTTQVSGDQLFMVMQRHFSRGSYDLLRKNCNDFSRCALEFLGCRKLPRRIQDMERVAKMAQDRFGIVKLITLGFYDANPNANDFDVGTVMQNLRLLRDGTMTEYGPTPVGHANVPMTTATEPIHQASPSRGGHSTAVQEVPLATEGVEPRQAHQLQRSTQVRGANIRGFHQTEVRHSRRRTVGRTRRLSWCCDDD